MNGSMVPLRTVVIFVAILVGIAFWVGVFAWNKNEYKCFSDKKFYGDWVTIVAIGKFEVRLKPFGCVESDRYNPKEWRPIWQYTPTPVPTKKL